MHPCSYTRVRRHIYTRLQIQIGTKPIRIPKLTELRRFTVLVTLSVSLSIELYFYGQPSVLYFVG